MNRNEWHKASSSVGTGACVEVQYRKSSFSGAECCVEVAMPAGEVLVRDTKDRARPPIAFPAAAWAAFVAGIKGGTLGAP